MTDADLLSAFENSSLPIDQWTHQAHIRVAYLYCSRYDLEAAIQQIRSKIKAFNKTTNTPEAIDRGYHETITQAFMRLVFAANVQSGPYETSTAFCEAHPELLDKRTLLRFYSRDRLMTWEAKSQYVEPDLNPMPSEYLIKGDPLGDGELHIR